MPSEVELSSLYTVYVYLASILRGQMHRQTVYTEEQMNAPRALNIAERIYQARRGGSHERDSNRQRDASGTI